jgi:hypothetical protein
MRTAGILIVSAALIVAGAESTLAAPRAGQQQTNAVISPALTGLLGQFPKGGAGLTRAIEAILDENPANTGAIVGLAKLGNPNQKAAIALGILRVLHRLDPSSDSAHIIRTALLDADPVFSAIFSALEMQFYAQNGELGEGRHGGNFFGSTGGGGFSGGTGGAPPFFVSPN